jgi:hypothetical protein
VRLGLGAFVLGVIATTAACSGGGGSTPTATSEAGSPTADAQTSVTVVASATPASSASPTSTPSTEPRINGLFNEPRVTMPTQQRSLGAMPASAFAPWNRIDVVLYDIAKKQSRTSGRALTRRSAGRQAARVGRGRGG